MEIWLRYDLRSPSFGTPTPQIVSALLEQVAWADSRGFDTVQLAEHHGMPDNYNPSPLPLVGAVAARTSRMRINPPLIIPFYDPVRLAEDCCLLDNISNGRFDITTVLGYVPREFRAYGVPFGDRGKVTDETLQVLRDVFDHGTFNFRGREGRVTPRPVQPGGPRIYVGGGNIKAAARRAARYGNGYYPLDLREEALDAYRTACAAEGKPTGKILRYSPVIFFFVAEDPDEAWAKIAPHAMHEANTYAEIAKETGLESPFPAAATSDELRAMCVYQVMTPDECIAYCRAEQAADRFITLVPMMGGLSPDMGWKNLELFVSKVMPALGRASANA